MKCCASFEKLECGSHVLYYQGCAGRKGADMQNVVSSERDQQYQFAGWPGSCCLLLSVNCSTSLSLGFPEYVIQLPYIYPITRFWHASQSWKDWWLHNKYFTKQFFSALGCLLILGCALILNSVQINTFCFPFWSPCSTTVSGVSNNALENVSRVVNNLFFPSVLPLHFSTI